MNKTLFELARLYCEQYDCESDTIRIHGYCPYDNYCMDGYFILSTVNDMGVSIYSVLELENDNITIIPAVYGRHFLGILDLFISLVEKYCDVPTNCLLYGSSYTEFKVENGELLLSK